MRLNVVELKNSLGDVLNKAEYQGERIIVHRRGKDPAAIISIADLRLFERLLEEAEVERAMRAGWSWSQVAEALGVTRQAVHKKHLRRLAAAGLDLRRRNG